ncbi:penicillin-binding transpeptidase domain-containing protein [Nocardioides sp. BP30]|uniref:penicillin-binding transpeptidase domain-containing protein n=1 Tax=Nocardioides sp. BP30 TaxID=3036374 RepID=UPI002468DE93|nr:penicillin-binding transpeptidase domain-containing protein [Nocardioides sp. BP30]WGL52686.1 penicillin-binding transpeptidase domain-containing protein [Nocardioides sp. BP30]
MRRALLGSVLVLALTGCGGGGGTPKPNEPDRASNVAVLAGALSGSFRFDQVRFAAGSSATTAAADYRRIVAGMGGVKPRVRAAGTSLRWSWPLRGGTWTYTTTVSARGADGPISWSPTAVSATLTDPKAVLRAASVEPERGDILGAGGQALVTSRPVVVFGIDMAQVAKRARAVRSARQLARRLGIDPEAYAKLVQAAGAKQFVEAITYRAGQAPLRAGQVAAIPGARVVHTNAALAPTKSFAAPILGTVGPVTADMVKKDPATYRAGDVAGLSGLEARYDDQLRGTPGTVVDRVAGDGTVTQVFDAQPVDGKPLTTTLDLKLQNLAEKLLAGVKPASALVALRPSTGEILAAANGPGNGGLNLATYGRMPPGSTFKTVDSLAFLRAGLTPSSTVPCTDSITVDGKRFTNDSDYPAGATGRVPLSTAIANSCNTAVISQRAKVSDDALASAAASLGFGVDHDTGFPAYFGQVPAAASETEKAADMIGQGKVLASPMVMASVIGAIQSGASTVPRLIAGTTLKPGGTPLTAAEDDQLKEIFRAVVTRGTGLGLADVPGKPVIAKTGTAEFDRDGKRLTHAWMIAAQGDLAVAVYVDEGVTGAQTAGPVVEGFLRGAAKQVR